MQSTEREALRYATGIRRALGFGSTIPTLEETALRALGPDGLAFADLREDGVMAVVQGEWRLFLAKRLTPERARWTTARQLTMWVMNQDGVAADEAALLRSRVAAELLLPTDLALRSFQRASGASLARQLRTPVAATLLREAELMRRPTALLGLGKNGRYARVRGDDEGRLPGDLATLELLASRRGIGVVRFQVPEDGGVVIRVAA